MMRRNRRRPHSGSSVAGFLFAAVLFLVACGEGVLQDGGDDSGVTSTAIPVDIGSPIGGDTTPPDPGLPGDRPGAPIEFAAVQVFFVDDGEARSVLRQVAKPRIATNAVAELLAGPSPAEAEDGLGSAVPLGTQIHGIVIRNGTAVVDLSGGFEQGGGITNIMTRLGQLVYTLTQFATVDEVVLELDGRRITEFSGEGVDLRNPMVRGDFSAILPLQDPEPVVSPIWDDDDLAGLDGGAGSSLAVVALVADEDFLNVRHQPGVEATIVGRLRPGTRALLTGDSHPVGRSTWVALETPIGAYWVNSFYLAADVDADDFAADTSVDSLVEQLVDVLEGRGDLNDVASDRGLFIAHNASPTHFGRNEIDDILTSSATRSWAPADGTTKAPEQTFYDAIAGPFLAAYDAFGPVGLRNEWLADDLPPEASPIPYRLQSFNYVGFHLAGSNPTEDESWYVSIDYEDGAPRIVALTVDSFAP